ncbi:MAG: FkbM family methyltransferase [Verrucomicrobiales bacterium]
MKIREIFYLLGLRPRLRSYGSRVDRFELSREGVVEFANWEHPRVVPKSVDQGDVDAIRSFLAPGDTAIDFGAHVGDTAVPMALAAGAEGCVFAFEPNLKAFEVLRRNAELNPGKYRIVPFPFAAAEAPGRLVFKYSDSGLGNGGELRGVSRWRHGHAFEVNVEAVEAETLLRRDYPRELRRLRFVKTDCEGADLSVLCSIAGLLREYSPRIRCEVYRHMGTAQRQELFEFLAGLGYRIHEYGGSAGFCGRPLGIDEVDHRAHYDIFAIPGGET